MWAAAFGEKAVVDFLLEKVRNDQWPSGKNITRYWDKMHKLTDVHLVFFSFSFRVQTPKQLQGGERAP